MNPRKIRTAGYEARNGARNPQKNFSRKHIYIYTHTCGPGSVVGIATAYGLDGPGIESRWGENFRASPDRP